MKQFRVKRGLGKRSHGVRRGPWSLVAFAVVFGLLATSGSFLLVYTTENETAAVEGDRRLLAQSSLAEREISMLGDHVLNTADIVGMNGSIPIPAEFERSVTGPLGDFAALDYLAIVEIVFEPEDATRISDREQENGSPAVVEALGATEPAGELLVTRSVGVAAPEPGEFVDDRIPLSRVNALLRGHSVSAAPAISPTAESQFTLLAPIVASDPAGGPPLVQAVLVGGIEASRLAELDGLRLAVDGLDVVSVDEAGDNPRSEVAWFAVADAVFMADMSVRPPSPSRLGSGLVLLFGLIVTAVGAFAGHRAGLQAVAEGRRERTVWLAHHDPMTGLANRLGLTAELDQMLRDCPVGEHVAVIFVDLDRIKLINDSLGHAAGDELLRQVGKRMDDVVRGADRVGRFGGDEFVVFGIVENDEAAMALAQRVLEGVRQPISMEGRASQTVSASAGVAVSAGGPVASGDAESEEPDIPGAVPSPGEELLRDADLAMHRAKQEGGDQASLFDAALRADALAALEIEQELRRAIRTGQIVVHYQPIIDTESARVDRFEALVRWQHPIRGMIPPGQFLGVASQSGLIVDLGEHVLRESCRQIALWSSASGTPVNVSVNLAERQLLDPNLPATVARVLAETGIQPEQLELELTEDLLVDRMEGHLDVLRELSGMGVKLAIDDFGTSRASLGQLKKLSMVDTLKIDRSFVTDVAQDSVDRKIINAIVALAESVGMEVVVEGVEEADQVAALRGLGVTLIQGFYFQRPTPSEKAVALLAKRFDVPEATVLELV